jgi:hypothetical protein
MEQHNLYDWLVVIFIHEIPGYNSTSDDLINTVKASGVKGSIAVYLIKDSYTKHDGPTPDTPIYYYRLSVSQLQADSSGKFQFLPVDGLEIENQNKYCWAQAFNYIYANVPSKKKILITFSHGAAFGISRDLDETGRAPIPSTQPQESPNSRSLDYASDVSIESNPVWPLDQTEIEGLLNTPQFIEKADDQTTADIRKGFIPKTDLTKQCSSLQLLWVTKLAAMLNDCLDGGSIDILMACNCYMQTFDAGYELKSSVDYFIGAEGGLVAFGYDYKSLLETISCNPGIDPKILAVSIVTDYVKMYQSLGRQYFLDNQALFANSLKLYIPAFQLFGKFLRILQDNMDKIISILVNIRNTKILYVSFGDQYNTNYLDMIDAFNWIKDVITALPDLFPDGKLLAEFADIHTEITTASAVGQALITHDQQYVPQYGYSGISIFYPLLQDRVILEDIPFCAYFGRENASRWKWIWRQFLNQYYAAAAQLPPAAQAPQPVPPPRPVHPVEHTQP